MIIFYLITHRREKRKKEKEKITIKITQINQLVNTTEKKKTIKYHIFNEYNL